MRRNQRFTKWSDLKNILSALMGFFPEEFYFRLVECAIIGNIDL